MLINENSNLLITIGVFLAQMVMVGTSSNPYSKWFPEGKL